MVKNVAHTPKLKKKFYPFVSVCTPTFNRRPFMPTMIECFKNYTYPKDRMEWIIVDDGTDPVGDILTKADVPQIRYIRSDKRMNLGEKRNYMHTFCKGTIVVYMDDDDYYPPERVSHAVDVLTNNKTALCAGSSEIYIYFKHIQKMIQCGPYGPSHATAGTFAFKIELLKQTKYDDHAALAEEKNFLKEYTIPFAQLDPLKTILVFSHEHNTFDKRKLLENPHPDYLKESTKKIEDFIKFADEAKIKKFFVTDIDKLLEKYEPGEAKMKPNVLIQIKQIEEQRKQMQQQQQQQQQQQPQQQGGKLIMSLPGQPPKEISQEEIIQIMNTYVTELQRLTQRNLELESQPKSNVAPITNNTGGFTDILVKRINQLEKDNISLNKKLNEMSIVVPVATTTSNDNDNELVQVKEVLEYYKIENQRLSESNQRLSESNQWLSESNQRLSESNQRLSESNQRLSESSQKSSESNQKLSETSQKSSESPLQEPMIMKHKSKSTPEVMVSIDSK